MSEVVALEFHLGQDVLADKNWCLELLYEMFPEADVADLRLRINSSFRDGGDAVEQTKLLLEQARMGGGFRKTTGPARDLQPWDRIRSNGYIKSVESLLRKEFKGLSRATIVTVMAENNNYFIRSRTVLFEISKKSWRYKLSSWWFRRSKVEAATVAALPLNTGCVELDNEIFHLGRNNREAQTASDLLLAQALNEKEYETHAQSLECECCFGDYAFEMMSSCCLGHLFCHVCVTSAVKEGIYGQTSSFTQEKGSIRCLSSTAHPPCEGFIPVDLMKQALPANLLQAMEDKFMEDSIAQSGLTIARCPFCRYAEVDELPNWKLKKAMVAIAMVAIAMVSIFFLSAPFPLLVLFVPPIFCLVIAYIYFVTNILADHRFGGIETITANIVNKAARKHFEKERGRMLICRNSPQVCGKRSCRECGKEWIGFHKCYENEEDALRLSVEKAMADAVKRTCPICGISFVKSDGCNKLTCVCGYVMCYVCRADLKGIGYKHFCQHFRQVPGTACTECDKCDLYVQEDETLVVKAAGERAQEDFLQKNALADGWKAPTRRIIAGVTLSSQTKYSSSLIRDYLEDTATKLEDYLEAIIERFIELETD